MQKQSLAGGAAGAVPPGTTFTVLASYTLNGALREAPIQLEAGGPAAEIDGIPTGTVVTLSEPALPEIAGVTWGAPRFASTDDGVVISADGTSAQVTIADQAVIDLTLLNTALPPVPSIDIEKWSTNEAGPAYDAAGSVTNDGYAGDHDGSNTTTLDPLRAEQITFTVSNNGGEALRDVVVTDRTDSGATITGLVCVFPDGSTGTTWAGPFAPAARFTCTGTLPALGAGASHSDTATVVAVGVTSGTSVTDQDVWSGRTPVTPPSKLRLPIVPSLAVTGASFGLWLPLGGALVLTGLGVAWSGRRRTG